MLLSLFAASGGSALQMLPLLAMLLFLAMFLGVLVRVMQRRRLPQYERMASLPLDDDSTLGGNDDD